VQASLPPAPTPPGDTPPREWCPPSRRPAVPLSLRSLLILLCALAALLPSAHPATAQTPDPRAYDRITKVPREELDRWLKEQVRASGGDLENQRYSWVVGFSTGHYGSDPVHAIAMRRLAFGLLNNTLAPGDRVTPVAWEMKVWRVGDPIILNTDPQTRAEFVDAVPYAPSQGSRGGHDTERAIYDTLIQAIPAGKSASSIVLLLTNTNQSQGPTGSRAELFGANNSQLAAEIKRQGFRSPVRHTFASAAGSRNLNIDVTALFPKQIAPLAGAPTGPRYPTFPIETWQPAADRPPSASDLPNPVQPATGTQSTTGNGGPTPNTQHPTPNTESPTAEPRGGIQWPLILGVLVLILGIVALVWYLKNRTPAPPQEEKPKVVAPKGRPLPGAIAAVLGAAPNDRRVTLKPLSTLSEWALTRAGEAAPQLSPPDQVTGKPLARVTFDDRGRMRLQAEGDGTFQGVIGIKADAGNPRLLVLAPGERLVCRLASTAAPGTATRIELSYQEKAS
jgi:hypothetical protein